MEYGTATVPHRYYRSESGTRKFEKETWEKNTGTAYRVVKFFLQQTIRSSEKRTKASNRLEACDDVQYNSLAKLEDLPPSSSTSTSRSPWHKCSKMKSVFQRAIKIGELQNVRAGQEIFIVPLRYR
jgi:hypothetical protein